MALLFSFFHFLAVFLKLAFFDLDWISRPKLDKMDKIRSLLLYNVYPITYKKWCYFHHFLTFNPWNWNQGHKNWPYYKGHFGMTTILCFPSAHGCVECFFKGVCHGGQNMSELGLPIGVYHIIQMSGLQWKQTMIIIWK